MKVFPWTTKTFLQQIKLKTISDHYFWHHTSPENGRSPTYRLSDSHKEDKTITEPHPNLLIKHYDKFGQGWVEHFLGRRNIMWHLPRLFSNDSSNKTAHTGQGMALIIWALHCLEVNQKRIFFVPFSLNFLSTSSELFAFVWFSFFQ